MGVFINLENYLNIIFSDQNDQAHEPEYVYLKKKKKKQSSYFATTSDFLFINGSGLFVYGKLQCLIHRQFSVLTRNLRGRIG